MRRVRNENGYKWNIYNSGRGIIYGEKSSGHDISNLHFFLSQIMLVIYILKGPGLRVMGLQNGGKMYFNFKSFPRVCLESKTQRSYYRELTRMNISPFSIFQ